jgi:hypothetical protein
MSFDLSSHNRLNLLTIAGALLAVMGSFSHGLAARNPQISTHKPVKAKPSAPTQPKELPVPFRIGEKLTYRVSWASFTTAASAELTIPERRDLYGWQTWHFRASAHTVSPVRALFSIDDQFDSYTDAASLQSRLYETYLNEMGRKQNQQWRLVSEGETKRTPGPAVVVLPGTRDPLGFLYSLRCVDWGHTPEIRAPVYDGHKLYDARAKLEVTSEPVEVSAGKFSAARVAIHLFQHDAAVSGIDFAVWIASDPACTPVLMRAQLPFGSLRVELISVLR